MGDASVEIMGRDGQLQNPEPCSSIIQEGNEASHDTTVNETPSNLVTEALPSAKKFLRKLAFEILR